MYHRKWSFLGTGGDLTQRFMIEHNALYEDWKKASLEVECLAKESGDLCDEIEGLRQQLAILHPGETVEGVVLERDSCRLEAERLRQDRTQPVKVKVRFACGVGDVMRHLNRAGASSSDVSRTMDYLAAHAVIDAPAGVPSVEDLCEIADAAFCSVMDIGGGWDARGDEYRRAMRKEVAAIRDAVLAGVQAPKCPTCLDKHAFCSACGSPDFREPTPEQVEALARVLQDAYSNTCGGRKNWEEWPSGVRDGFLAEARAAFAHIQQPERPKGLPTARELAEKIAMWPHDDTLENTAARILAVLRPYLHEPTGWTLDVTAEEAYRRYVNGDGRPIIAMQAVLDLCRSRIRPTFGCKECKEKDNKIHSLGKYYSDVQSKIEDLRATLEGE